MPASVTVLPAIEGSPPNCPRHKSALIITTSGAPGLSSSGRKLRPTSGLTSRMRRKFAETRALFNTRGSTMRDSAMSSGPAKDPISVLERLAANNSSNRTGVAPAVTSTTRSGSWYRSGLSKTAWTSEKIAVLAPMPRLSVSNATAVKPVFFRNCRNA